MCSVKTWRNNNQPEIVNRHSCFPARETGFYPRDNSRMAWSAFQREGEHAVGENLLDDLQVACVPRRSAMGFSQTQFS